MEVLRGSEHRPSSWLTPIGALRSDLLFAVRSLRKNALLSAVVVATLTFGIGLDAGVFSLINAAAFRPRIDRNPETFLKVFPVYTENGSARGAGQVTLRDFAAFQQSARTLSHLTAWSDARVPYSADDPTQLRGLLVACNFFSVTVSLLQS